MNDEKVQVVFMFVGDFKVYYALLCMKAAQSMYPCPWCRTPLSKIDQHLRSLTKEELAQRPTVPDLCNISHGTNWQKAGTFNFMNLYSRSSFNPNRVFLVPPLLHIKLGLINKVVDSLDLVVQHLQELHGM